MTNIFERYAPRWRLAVVKYARSVWMRGAEQDDDARYDRQAILFSREYRHALEKHYADKGMTVYRGTLDGKVAEWIRQQDALKETLKVIAENKKSKLIQDEIEKLEKNQDPQAMINKLYEAKENETVYKVFSFADNFKDLAGQHGDENAFALGTGINEAIISQYSDKYFWRTQKDRRVRDTHQQLDGKCFLFSDPPTTIDKYGNKFAGNPGLAWGCRCWADPASEKEKAIKNYVVHERKR